MPTSYSSKRRPPKNILAPKSLHDPYGNNANKIKPRQRPWASTNNNTTTSNQKEQQQPSIKQKWKAGGLRVSRNYLGRGVSKPKPFLSYNDQIKLQQYEQKYIQQEENNIKKKKEQVLASVPQYSVKYVGVTQGDMGVLSKRCLMPTTTNRIPNNRNYTPKEQKYRLDPEYVRKMKLTNKQQNRPNTASGISISSTNKKKQQVNMKRPVTSPSKGGPKYFLNGTTDDNNNNNNNNTDIQNNETTKIDDNDITLNKNRHTASRNSTFNNNFINNNNNTSSRPQTAPYRQSQQLWNGGNKHNIIGNENGKRPETAPHRSNAIIGDNDDDDDEEGGKPNPEKYDRWIVRAIPPRPALSAGRKRHLLPVHHMIGGMNNNNNNNAIANPNLYSNFGRRENYSQKYNRLARLRPGSAPPSSYIISSQHGGGINNNHLHNFQNHQEQQQRPNTAANMQQLQKRLQQHQQQRILQQVEVPYQVHQRIRGWKLTSPHNVGFNPNDSHTRKQMYNKMRNQQLQQQMMQHNGNNNNNKIINPTKLSPSAPHNFSNMVKHERLTAEDIMAENMGRVAMMRQQQQLTSQQYINSVGMPYNNNNNNVMVGDLNAPPSLLQPMMDPLNQAVEEEKRLRVKMRQTSAVVNTLDRFQRGRSAKPWRSGHHWDAPHPEVPLNIGKEFRWMSSTPSEYANMVRQNEMEMNYDDDGTADGMNNNNIFADSRHNNTISNSSFRDMVRSSDDELEENELYLQHLQQKFTRFEENS